MVEVSILPEGVYRVAITHLGSGRAPERESRSSLPGEYPITTFKDGRPPWQYPGPGRDLLLIKGPKGYESKITLVAGHVRGWHGKEWRWSDGPGIPKELFIHCAPSAKLVNFSYSRPIIVPPRDHAFRTMPKTDWRPYSVVEARGKGWDHPHVAQEINRLALNGPKYTGPHNVNQFVCRTPEAAEELAVFLKLMLG